MSSLIPFFEANNISYQKKDDEIVIRCVSGLHKDTNPSLFINEIKGVFNCFSCGYRGNIKALKEKLNIPGFDNPMSKQEFDIAKLKRKLNEKIMADPDVIFPEITMPVRTEFKGINVNTLKRFGAFTSPSAAFADYIFIPVVKGNKIQFFEGRAMQSNITPKYLRYPSGSKVKNMFFPYNELYNHKKIILVEGIYDALNMIQFGYPAFCVFGVNNFHTEKAKILSMLGISEVYILFDGDSPGRVGAMDCYKELEKQKIDARIITCIPEKDPGSLTQKEMYYLLGEFNNV